MNYIESQFSNPRGFIGHMVGLIMAYENRSRNQWAISLLNIQPADRILEIGFGPGWAIRQASKLATLGLVAGVDSSATMVKQAGIRNRAKVKSGQAILRHSSAVNIPFEDNAFDKVYAVNSFHEWNDSQRGIKEARRVLVPGGSFLIIEHPHGNVTEASIAKVGEQIQGQLVEGGFESVQVVFNSIHGRMAVGVQGVKA